MNGFWRWKKNTPTTWSICWNNTVPIRLTFVRHGATDWNRDRRFQGQVDIPLNREGHMQARALSRALDDEAFDYAVSSDLARAFETAQTIRGQARVERDERWREFAFGQWEGLTWEEIVERFPEMREHGTTAAKRYAPPGGETFEAVCARVGRALQDLRSGQHANVLVVTHAGPLHAMLHTLFGDRIAQMHEILGVRFSPASVTRITIEDGRPELISLNDVAHLNTPR